MKNKLLKLMMAIALTSSLIACAKPEEKIEEQVVGGWEFVDSPEASLPEEEKTMFEEVAKEYKPIALLATQVVSGTNYCFLAEENETYVLVKIYRDLEGNAEVLEVRELEAGDMESGLAGGWNLVEDNYACPSRVDMDILYKAQQEYTEDTFELIATLETQIVSGTNYRYLCKSDTKLVLVTVYENLDGKAEISDVVNLSIE